MIEQAKISLANYICSEVQHWCCRHHHLPMCALTVKTEGLCANCVCEWLKFRMQEVEEE